jgi:hemolysin III
MARPFREEAFSFFTHLAGALLGVAGLVLLVLRAESAVATAAYATYGATLVGMFASSTLHHVRAHDAGFFRRLDHVAIYLFIAGTYTPFCLLVLPPAWGLSLLTVVGGLALVGSALKLALPFTPRWVTVAFYIALGWAAVVATVPIVETLPGWGISLLAGGGIVYTVGAVIYARQRPDPWPRVVGFHGLWHVFVLVGAALHFALVWLLVPVA